MDDVTIYISNDVSEVRRLYRSIVEQVKDGLATTEYLSQCAEKLFFAHHSNEHAAYVEINNGFTPLTGKSVGEIFNYAFTMLDARHTVAKLHGYDSWEAVEKDNSSINMAFEQAIDTLLAGNHMELKQLISSNNALINQVSPFGHRARLLHYCASNGVEIRRQVVPENIAQMAELLIDCGADKKATMWAYGGTHTAYELAATSSHPEDAGVQKDLLKILK